MYKFVCILISLVCSGSTKDISHTQIFFWFAWEAVKHKVFELIRVLFPLLSFCFSIFTFSNFISFHFFFSHFLSIFPIFSRFFSNVFFFRAFSSWHKQHTDKTVLAIVNQKRSIAQTQFHLVLFTFFTTKLENKQIMCVCFLFGTHSDWLEPFAVPIIFAARKSLVAVYCNSDLYLCITISLGTGKWRILNIPWESIQRFVLQ